MNASEPKVSICIPTYNRASMVRLAIESALNQTYRNIEVVVVDNASTDNIGEVIAGYDDPRLRFVRNEENVGQFGNFNRCIELSRGEYIHILHSDDYIEPDFTDVCLTFLASHPDVALTFSSAVFESPDGINTLYYAEGDEVIPAPEGFRRLLRVNNFIICPSVMARRDVYSTIGKFSFMYPYSGDFYQWLRIGRVFDIGYVRDAVIHCREGKHSESFHLLGKSPSGFLDMINVVIQIVSELGDNQQSFRPDINTFFQTYIALCLNFSQLSINNRIARYNPIVFTGLALFAWGMIQPQNKREFLGMGCLFGKIMFYFFLTSVALLKRMGSVNHSKSFEIS